MKARLLLAALVGFVATSATAQPPYPGRTLITPVRSTETFLIDMDLNTVQSWHGDNGAGHTVYLLPDGSVIRAQGDPAAPLRGGGGSGGHLQRIDENDNVVWDYFFSNSEHQQHHDIEPMPNGNVLVIAWERRTRDEALALGLVDVPGDEVLPTLIAELEPVGTNDANVVWEWRIWDHIVQDVDPSKPNYGVVADHPERVDINVGGGGSWDHANHIDYNPRLDLILFSARRLNEVFVIDHSTTTREAAGSTGGNYGRGGDILYRWGNPQNYDRGGPDDQVFWGVHGANWIDALLPGAGGILAFNNGNREGEANDSSSVVEVYPPRNPDGSFALDPGAAYGPAEPDWEYTAGKGFYSLRYGSGYRMPNGNTLICEGAEGNIFEVNPDGTKVWVYVEPIGRGVFAAQRYWDPVALESALDVLPGDCANTLAVKTAGANGNGGERGRGGVVQVAVFGGPTLDADWIDASSVRLAGVEPFQHGVRDIGGPAVDDGCPSDRPDGADDLVLKFGRRDLMRAIGPVTPGDVIPVELVGALQDGTPFRAEDVVSIGTRGPQRIEPLADRSARLDPATPNPFNPSTSIAYEVPNGGHVLLVVYDVAGRVVRTLMDETVPAGAGTGRVAWDGRDDRGERVASGVYFYRMTADGFERTRRMVLLK